MALFSGPLEPLCSLAFISFCTTTLLIQSPYIKLSIGLLSMIIIFCPFYE